MHKKFISMRRKMHYLKNRACYRCLNVGHVRRKCIKRLKCILCGKPPEEWTQELVELNIDISDAQKLAPVELLLGADVAERLYRGNL